MKHIANANNYTWYIIFGWFLNQHIEKIILSIIFYSFLIFLVKYILSNKGISSASYKVKLIKAIYKMYENLKFFEIFNLKKEYVMKPEK